MPAWLSIVLALGGSQIITTLVSFYFGRALKKSVQARDEKQKQEDLKQKKDKCDLETYRYQQERRKNLDDIKMELKLAINPIKEEVVSLSDKIEKIQVGTQCTLRNDITNFYYSCAAKGYRSDNDYTNIHKMYDQYKQLEGNTYIDDIIVRFDSLPPKEEIRKSGE